MAYTTFFTNISQQDTPMFGGKNAAIGEMLQHLKERGVRIPHGFATTSKAYWQHLQQNDLTEYLRKQLARLDTDDDLATLREVGKNVRQAIVDAQLPEEIAQDVCQSYKELSRMYDQDACDVAVRSSATAEDLPEASFAGQQDTFLNVSGCDELITACKKSMASLFTDRAIRYREERGFDHMSVALSVGIQKMVRSDKASAGVAFTLDTETGFRDVIAITSSYGLGEAVVKGEVNPDEFFVHQTKVQEGYQPIMQKKLGDKRKKVMYAEDGQATTYVSVDDEQRHHFSLQDDEICELARYAARIEAYYSEKNDTWYPMDIEWAKDGLDGHIYIVQARPETVHSQQQERDTITEYTLDTPRSELETLVTGQRIGRGIVTGRVREAQHIEDISEFHEGDILVTEMTDPDWGPIMKKAGAIITDLGGRTSHAAIVSRELGIPAVIGTDNATKQLDTGDTVTVDCSQGGTGYVYAGEVSFSTQTHTMKSKELPYQLYLNLAHPGNAFYASFYPVDGVGLARLEFIVASIIQVHPQAVTQADQIDDDTIHDAIAQRARGYRSPHDFFVSVLAQSIGHMAGAFYPRPVIVRMTDLKTNEYRQLIGGSYFEPENEPNPMLGFRGVSRYLHEDYQDAFSLECQALYRARYDMGFDNIIVMAPFVRTPQEMKDLRATLGRRELVDHEQGVPLYMMVELPANVIRLEDFLPYCDGFSIGSNDLTQLVLGVDRDSAQVRHLFNERDPAVKHSMQETIKKAHDAEKPVGICGQAPSDFPEIAEFLIDHGIDSISLNTDSIMPFIERYQGSATETA